MSQATSAGYSGTPLRIRLYAPPVAVERRRAETRPCRRDVYEAQPVGAHPVPVPP